MRDNTSYYSICKPRLSCHWKRWLSNSLLKCHQIERTHKEHASCSKTELCIALRKTWKVVCTSCWNVCVKSTPTTLSPKGTEEQILAMASQYNIWGRQMIAACSPAEWAGFPELEGSRWYLGNMGEEIHKLSLATTPGLEEKSCSCHPLDIPAASDVKIIPVEQAAPRALVSSSGLMLGLSPSLCLHVNIHRESWLTGLAPFRTSLPLTGYDCLPFPSNSPQPKALPGLGASWIHSHLCPFQSL